MHEGLLQRREKRVMPGVPSLSGWRPERSLLLGPCSMKRQESEPQRQQRLTGGIHERIVSRLAMDLPALAFERVVPQEWFTADLLSTSLEQSGYWLRHPEPLAAFLSPEQRARLTDAALALSASESPAHWWRDGERYQCTVTADWDLLAQQTMARLLAERPDEARTALFSGRDSASVIFVNHDDAADKITPDAQLASLRSDLRTASIPELAFARSADRRAWVMLVWAKEEDRLQTVLFAAWEKMSGIER